MELDNKANIDFFACLSTKQRARSINTQKRMPRPIFRHLDLTLKLVNKEFTMNNGARVTGNLKRTSQIAQFILTARVVNHGAGFPSSFPRALSAI